MTDQTDQVISVNLVHKIITVNANKPYAQGTLIDTSNPTGATYPDGVANADLNRILMRTITYSYAGSQDSINTIGQGALFTRTATVDEVTGTLLAIQTGKSALHQRRPSTMQMGVSMVTKPQQLKDTHLISLMFPLWQSHQMSLPTTRMGHWTLTSFTLQIRQSRSTRQIQRMQVIKSIPTTQMG
ncbi:mucin-binding protein [Secundilactobacillus paracollinoides]|uniref:mucin-binding protein n=1 Tax=Secundilactobacillus paracollinoides TaxID=240427 RepID=UPI0012E196B7|nr:hypothetical protein [Secundilactobacillus paracollinoides]